MSKLQCRTCPKKWPLCPKKWPKWPFSNEGQEMSKDVWNFVEYEIWLIRPWYFHLLQKQSAQFVGSNRTVNNKPFIQWTCCNTYLQNTVLYHRTSSAALLLEAAFVSLWACHTSCCRQDRFPGSTVGSAAQLEAFASRVSLQEGSCAFQHSKHVDMFELQLHRHSLKIKQYFWLWIYMRY